MKVRGRIGVRLKVDPLVLADGLEDVATAFAERISAAWQLAQSEPVLDGVAGRAAVGNVTFGWSGARAGDASALLRKRVESRLRQAVGRLTTVPLLRLPVPSQAGTAAWSSREVELTTTLDRFLGAMFNAREGRNAANVKALTTRYSDVLQEPVAGIVWIIDIHAPLQWRTLIRELLSESATRFGASVPYFYIWDNERREELVGLDPVHLRGQIPQLQAPPVQPAEDRDFTLTPGLRFAFAACALPELELEDWVIFGKQFAVKVPFQSLVVSNFIDSNELMAALELSQEQLENHFLQWSGHDIDVQVLPVTMRRPMTVASLEVLLLEQARRIEIHAARFGRLLLLTRQALDALPFELAMELRKLVDDQTLGVRSSTSWSTHWQTNWTGVYVLPILRYLPAQVARSTIKQSIALYDKTLLIGRITNQEALGTFIDELDGRDWMVFELWLDELERRGLLTQFFDGVRQARGARWEYERTRKFKVTRLASETRHREHPALLALVRSLQFHGFEASILESPHHVYDLATQTIHLSGGSGFPSLGTAASQLRAKLRQRVLRARGNNPSDKAGVIAEVRGYYSESATVYQPNAELLAKLSEPVRRKIGQIAARMACSGNETMTEQQLIAAAMQEALKEVPNIERKDLVAVQMHSSLRVLALEEPIIDGVPQLRIRVEPVSRIGDGPWQATGRAELLSPGGFEARLTYYHVQHMLTVLTIATLATMVVAGAVFIVAAGIASLAEVVLMIVIGEVMYLWTTPREERTLQGFLMAALVAELDVIGFKALSFVGKSGLKLVAGRVLTGKLIGSTITKWITFGLRSTVTAAEVGAVGVLDLFAHELFHATRCRGFSSGEAYWDRFKSGFKIGLAFEFVVVPWLAPVLRVGLQKASTYLEAAQILSKAERSFGEIVGTLLRGKKGLEEALGRTLEPKLADPLARAYNGVFDRFWGALRREYQSRAYRSLLELLDVNLDRVGSEGLSRLLKARTDKQIDALLQKLKESKVPPADFMRLVGQLENDALLLLLEGTNLQQLAGSPHVMALFRSNPASALHILRGSFGFAVSKSELYLAELARLPTASRDSVLRALLEREPLPPNMLLDAARGLGALDANALRWMRVLHERNISTKGLFANSGERFRKFVQEFSRYSAGDQALALQIAQQAGKSSAEYVNVVAKRNQTLLSQSASDIAPTRDDVRRQLLEDKTRNAARSRIKAQHRDKGAYQTVILDTALAENIREYAVLKARLRAFNPDAVYAVDRGGPFIADVITYGDSQLASRIRRWPKPAEKAGWDEAIEAMQKEIEDAINGVGGKPPQTRFAFTDVYFSGASYNKFQELMKRLAEKYPNASFQGVWIREQLGFEVAVDSLGGIGLSAPKAATLRNISNEIAPVQFVIGDDAARIVEATGAEPIYVFDRNGVIQRVITPRPGETTRQLVVRLLNGGT